jgi:hypothetical protein
VGDLRVKEFVSTVTDTPRSFSLRISEPAAASRWRLVAELNPRPSTHIAQLSHLLNLETWS